MKNTPCLRNEQSYKRYGRSSQDENITFFERGVTDFICSVALRRYERFGSAARWISHRAGDDPFAVLGDGS